MRSLCWCVVALWCAGCGTRSADAPTPPPPPPPLPAPLPQPMPGPPPPPPPPPQGVDSLEDGPIQWRLTMPSTELSMAGRAHWRIGIAAFNTGTTTLDPRLGDTQLLVNGQPSQVFTMAFGNGTMDPRWRALPPREEVEAERELGESLFTAPGDFELVLVHGSARMSVRVHVSAPRAPAPLGARLADVPRDGAIGWRLRPSARTVSMANRARWRLEIAATNHGSATVDPQMTMMELTVNGESDITLSNAFINGGTDRRWFSLPPGETVTAERELAESIFRDPGEYEIVLVHGNARVSTRVRVTP